jgi:hypothetical protein
MTLMPGDDVLTSRDGRLQIEGVDTRRLADEFGTPLFVMSELLGCDVFGSAELEVALHCAWVGQRRPHPVPAAAVAAAGGFGLRLRPGR